MVLITIRRNALRLLTPYLVRLTVLNVQPHIVRDTTFESGSASWRPTHHSTGPARKAAQSGEFKR